MKIIELLNKIANEEEVPKKIKYNNETFTIRKEKDDYANQNHWFTDRFCLLDLNEEVEIIEEDKKIEKLKIEQDTPNSNFYIRNENGTKCGLTKHSKIIADKINEIIDKVNKGE